MKIISSYLNIWRGYISDFVILEGPRPKPFTIIKFAEVTTWTLHDNKFVPGLKSQDILAGFVDTRGKIRDRFVNFHSFFRLGMGGTATGLSRSSKEITFLVTEGKKGTPNSDDATTPTTNRGQISFYSL